MGRVLIIDDSRLAGMVVQKILGPRGIECIHARTAAEAFGFQGHPCLLEEKTPDVILLDVLMPDMDGLQVLKRLKGMRLYRDIPVIMLTASASETIVKASIGLGAVGFLSKPFDPKKLLKELVRIDDRSGLHRFENLLTEAEKNADKEEQQVNTPYRDDLVLSTMNLNRLLDILEGDLDALKLLITAFIEKLPNLINAIGHAIQEQDTHQLRMSSHTLKGTVSNFGADATTELARTLMNMHQNTSWGEVLIVFGKLQSNARHLLSDLKEWLASHANA